MDKQNQIGSMEIETNEEQNKPAKTSSVGKKILKFILLALTIIVMIFLFIFGPFIKDLLIKPGKPKIKHGEFPFKMVYEYNGDEYIIEETLICDFESYDFSPEMGVIREWDCKITNDESELGRYYPNKEGMPDVYIQIPLEPEYYMGASYFEAEWATPYIFFIDESTGTTYYEWDLNDLLGMRIISWEIAEPIQNTFR